MSLRAPLRSDPESGYALLELLVACFVLSAAIGAYIQIAAASQRLVDAQGTVVDLQQRVRVAADMIARDLAMAGAGPIDAPGVAALQETFAPLIPARTGERNADPELSHAADRISIVYVPDTPAQTSTSADMDSAGEPVPIDASRAPCPGGGACGFVAGDRVLVFDPADPAGGHDLFTVTGTSAGYLSHAGSLSRAYRRGSLVASAVQRVYYLDRTGRRLMLYDGDQSDLPLVDHVVDLAFTYYADPRPAAVRAPSSGVANCVYTADAPPVPLLPDLGGTALKALTPAQLRDGPACGAAPNRFDGDLLRVRRVRMTIRLEADSALARGSGTAFVNAGVSPDGLHYVADQVLTVDVSPRNLNLFR